MPPVAWGFSKLQGNLADTLQSPFSGCEHVCVCVHGGPQSVASLQRGVPSSAVCWDLGGFCRLICSLAFPGAFLQLLFPVTANFKGLPAKLSTGASEDSSKSEKVPAGAWRTHYGLLMRQEFRRLNYLKWQD